MTTAPQKINNFILFDFETGGLDRKEGLHSKKYPITEFAAIVIDGVSLEEIIRYDNLVKPYDNNLLYDKEAARITGITRELCERDGIPLRQLVDDICVLFETANPYKSKTARPILIAHNAAFDRGFMQDIFRRANIDLSKYIDGDKSSLGEFIPETLDTINYGKQLWAETTCKDDKFTLSACCEKAGIDLIDGHRAMNDVIPMVELFRYYMRRLRSGSNEIIVNNTINTTESIEISNHRINFEW